MLVNQGLVIGYHGCDESVRDQLVDRSLPHLFQSKNPYDWLGDGIYFFENDYDRALHFANMAARYPNKKLTRGRIDTPSVVGAVIRLGTCWDLSTTSGMQLFKNVHARMTEVGIQPKHNKAADANDEDLILRPFDRAIINTGNALFDSERQSYDSMRALYSQGKSVIDGSGFKELTHVQIAIRNPRCILGYFTPINS
jgi:hypothetical protein